jgi:hypothetical protein
VRSEGLPVGLSVIDNLSKVVQDFTSKVLICHPKWGGELGAEVKNRVQSIVPQLQLDQRLARWRRKPAQKAVAGNQ